MNTLIRWQVLVLLAPARAVEIARRALADVRRPVVRPGQGMAEYAIIASVVVTIVIVGLTVLANGLSDFFTAIAAWFANHRPT